MVDERLLFGREGGESSHEVLVIVACYIIKCVCYQIFAVCSHLWLYIFRKLLIVLNLLGNRKLETNLYVLKG